MLLATRPGRDLRPAYQAYGENVEKTRKAAETTRRRFEQMNADSARYFSGWKSDNEKISNKQMRKTANQRLEAVQKDYKNSAASLEAAAAKFKPFVSDLADIQTTLANDLTGKGIATVKEAANRANADHAGVLREVQSAATHLNATRTALLPLATE